MGYTVKQKILLLCVIIHLIRGICSLHCPRYTKYEAFRKGLLNDKAICKAAIFGYDDEICLNGLEPNGFYCATGSCNIFGFMCDGHCLSGDDNTDMDSDYEGKCNDIIHHERVKFCEYYEKKINQSIGLTDELGGLRQFYSSANLLRSNSTDPLCVWRLNTDKKK